METVEKIQEENRLTKRSSLYGFETRDVDKRFTTEKHKKSHNIKSLWQRSHEVIGLALQGHPHKDIAALLNISVPTVSNILNSELGEKKLSTMREKRDEEYIDVSKKVLELSEKALKMYDEIFDSETVSYNLKKATADSVLMDLGGHRAPTKIDTRSMHLTATTEEITEFKRLGIKAAKESGYLIEVPDEESPHELETIPE